LSFQSFESLDVWKRASRLAVDVYAALEKCRDFALRDQITRSAISIPSNIAEGYERDTNAEFVRFLNIAKGSAAELRTQLYIAREVGKIERPVVATLINEVKGVSAMLHALAKVRKQRIKEPPSQYAPEMDPEADFPEPGTRNPEPGVLK
jgi:four helix bundle protein